MTTSEKKYKIALGCDHAGFEYKEAIKGFLQSDGYETKDFGTFSDESVDYPDFIRPAAEAVAEGLCDFGIVLGGSGNGEAIAANKAMWGNIISGVAGAATGAFIGGGMENLGENQTFFGKER